MEAVDIRRFKLLDLAAETGGKENRKASYKEFGAQLRMSLSTRLKDSGFPVNALDHQERSHTTIFKLASEYFYDGKVISPRGGFELCDEYKRALREVTFGTESADVGEPATERPLSEMQMRWR